MTQCRRMHHFSCAACNVLLLWFVCARRAVRAAPALQSQQLLVRPGYMAHAAAQLPKCARMLDALQALLDWMHFMLHCRFCQGGIKVA